MKYCRQCGGLFPLSEFYRHDKMADGHLNKCKSCVKQRVRKYRIENIEAVQDYDRKRGNLPHRVAAAKAYAKTEAGKVSHARALERQRALRPERYAAKVATSNAVRGGRLKKLPCWVCGEIKVEAHHPAYSMPLDVVWLCVPHHRQLHAGVA